MSTKEMIYNMIDGFSEEQLVQVCALLASVKKMLNEEAEDDAFCQKMLDDYRSDADPHKHDSVTLDEFAKELGINLDEL